MKNCTAIFLARIAQSAEQDTLNVKVPSSILGAGTTSKFGLRRQKVMFDLFRPSPGEENIFSGRSKNRTRFT